MRVITPERMSMAVRVLVESFGPAVYPRDLSGQFGRMLYILGMDFGDGTGKLEAVVVFKDPPKLYEVKGDKIVGTIQCSPMKNSFGPLYKLTVSDGILSHTFPITVHTRRWVRSIEIL